MSQAQSNFLIDPLGVERGHANNSRGDVLGHVC